VAGTRYRSVESGRRDLDDSERVVTGLDPVPYRGPTTLPSESGAGVREAVCGNRRRGPADTGRREPRRATGRRRGEGAAGAAGLEVVLVDETGTTKAAEERLAGAGVPRRRWAALVDGVAAVVILEEMLETRQRARKREGGAVDLDADRC